MRPVAPPDWVRTIDLGPVIVVVNYVTGGHHTLSEQARDLWRMLATTGNADTATAATPATDIVKQLMCRGLLAEVPTAQPWPPSPVGVCAPSWGTIERAVCLPRLPPTSRRWRKESVAAMLALTLAGYRASWCHGVAADPLRLHAWIEADGKAVGEPASTELFTPIMRIPSGWDNAARRRNDR